jgi:sporulation protein YlmC with PRC-barrel domain
MDRIELSSEEYERVKKLYGYEIIDTHGQKLLILGNSIILLKLNDGNKEEIY